MRGKISSGHRNLHFLKITGVEFNNEKYAVSGILRPQRPTFLYLTLGQRRIVRFVGGSIYVCWRERMTPGFNGESKHKY